MNALDAKGIAGLAWRGADWRHGVRLTLAVVLAFLVSSAFHLPESFWAVMSTLIVVRPTTGSALGAGWDRVRGTMTGTAVGLAGVWLHHVGLGSSLSTLAIIAVVAFASAVVPTMRSAPISALIILDSGGIAGHSAMDVAALRAIEILIGVVVGVLVSLIAFAAHARHRFDEDCAAWLRNAATQAGRDLSGEGGGDAEAREARSEASRKSLRALVELAVGADREARLLALLQRRERPESPRHAALARLMARIAADVGALVRATACAPAPLDAVTRSQLGHVVRDALTTHAGWLAGPGADRAAPVALRSWATAAAPVAWIAAPARLLLQDLAQLRRLAAQDRNEETS